MPLHNDLLTLARRLVPEPLLSDLDPIAPSIGEADLRRGVSTAYYALFHLLIHEAMARIVADPDLRSRIGRSFNHVQMKQVCEEYAKAKLSEGALAVRGAVIASQLQRIGRAFVELQQARHDADYDTAKSLEHENAYSMVMKAEDAFLDWAACQADESSGVFLTELFLRSVTKRS